MEKYSCIIIEDEPLALERTKDFVNKIPFLNLCASFDNALNGLAYLNRISLVKHSRKMLVVLTLV